MNIKPSRIGTTSLAAALVALILVPSAQAKGRAGGSHPAARHTAGAKAPKAHAARPSKPQHQAAPKPPKPQKPKPQQANRPPKVQQPKPQQANRSTKTQKGKPQAANRSTTAPNQVTPRPSNSITGTPSQALVGRGNRSIGVPSRSHVYRRGVRRYRGSGYSNRYASANQNSRAIVAQLRSTHTRLARLNRDYNGHRARAMSQIRRAIRQLGYGSTLATRSSSRAGLLGVRNPGVGAGAAARPMSQATSDTHMRRARGALQSVATHMTNTYGYQGSGYIRARSSVRRAVRELNTALAIR